MDCNESKMTAWSKQKLHPFCAIHESTIHFSIIKYVVKIEREIKQQKRSLIFKIK